MLDIFGSTASASVACDPAILDGFALGGHCALEVRGLAAAGAGVPSEDPSEYGMDEEERWAFEADMAEDLFFLHQADGSDVADVSDAG